MLIKYSITILCLYNFGFSIDNTVPAFFLLYGAPEVTYFKILIMIITKFGFFHVNNNCHSIIVITSADIYN